MAWLLLDATGAPAGYFSNPQNMNQPAYAGMSLIEVDDSDPRLVPAPPPKPLPTPRAWLERLSPATELTLETAALANPVISLWLRKATGADFIDVTLPETQQGVAAMVALGLLTEADQAALLTP